jgi:hypothetical protein
MSNHDLQLQRKRFILKFKMPVIDHILPEYQYSQCRLINIDTKLSIAGTLPKKELLENLWCKQVTKLKPVA